MKIRNELIDRVSHYLEQSDDPMESLMDGIQTLTEEELLTYAQEQGWDETDTDEIREEILNHELPQLRV